MMKYNGTATLQIQRGDRVTTSTIPARITAQHVTTLARLYCAATRQQLRGMDDGAKRTLLAYALN
jgi:hypothetical protein